MTFYRMWCYIESGVDFYRKKDNIEIPKPKNDETAQKFYKTFNTGHILSN